jgi:alpha-galactosidase
LKYVNAIDMKVAGTNPVLKGILGDHANQYAPYEYDLTKRDVNFTSLKGRATHIYFPYFNLENDNGGALFAIGWGGTWQADFTYDENTQETRFKGTGTVGLNTYLKPGEVVRTPLIAKVCYYERDEDVAMNKWRKWVIDCNMPQENEASGTVVQPCTSVMLAYDTGRPNSDGSISEGYDSWKRSLDAFYDHGLTTEYRWFDAGWYFTPYKKTEKSDWWGSVGTWDLDTVKWPDGSFKESVDYAAARGTKTLMWFEPERVTRLDGMVANYGYKREWVLSDHGNNNTFVNNLGIPECLDWTLERIVNTMDQNGIHLYREDFNLDPGIFWTIGDGYEGENRDGITENLYMQGHYALWDGIIEYCASTGKQTYIDSCASGGGRNDLETLRRAVPFLRSDSDRTTCELRLAMTTRLVRWIPYTGASAKESANQLTNGLMDTYVMRATMLPKVGYTAGWYHDQDKIEWEVLRQAQAEWKEFKKYFYEDFYVLTPQRSTTETKEWTVYEYFDSDTDSGVIQAFRPINAAEKTYKIQVKGIDANRYYTLRDVDGVNSKAKVKGSALQKGLPLILNDARSSLILYIEPCQD